ncbi:MAG: anti-sigma factor domain-containing protein [Planctomycetota bacterium]
MPDAHDPYLELCVGYALDALDADELERFEAHLRVGCAACAREVRNARDGAAALAATVPSVAPPPAARARLLRALRAAQLSSAIAPEIRVAETGAGLRRLRPFGLVSLSGWAAACALGVWLTLSLQQMNALKSDITGLAIERDRLEKERRWAGVLTSPSSQMVVLLPTEDDLKEVKAHLVYDEQQQMAAIVFLNLPAQADKDFQLWAIRDGKPSSLGLVAASDGGYQVVRLDAFPSTDGLSAIAVSLEEKGGAPTPNAPQGRVVMMGKVP